MIRTQIQIQDEQIRWLKRYALDRGVSMAQLIRDCIDFYRGHIEKSKKLMSKKKNALAAVGNFSSIEKSSG
jgi:hypothetical protein